MKDDVALRLAETVAWCEAAVTTSREFRRIQASERSGHFLRRWFERWRKPNVPDLRASIRTPALRPPALAGRSGYELVGSLSESPVLASESVAFINARRRDEIQRRGIVVAPIGSCSGRGRILCIDFETDLCSAAVRPSAGFFDDDDVPPWDTWFHHASEGRRPGGTVFCWVPNELVEHAQAGLDVIPIHFMRWTEEVGAVDDNR